MDALPQDRMAHGVLTTSDDAGCWAWFGSEVVAAVDLGRASGYYSLTEQERYDKALRAEAGWLSRCWDPVNAWAMELRWLADGQGGVRLFALGRVATSSPEHLSAAAERGRRAIDQAAPDHVVLEPIASKAVAWALAPFEPAGRGAAELRKRCVIGSPSRLDAGVAYYFAIQSLRPDPARWPLLLAHLAESPNPLMLSIGLEPLVVGDQVHQVLGHQMAAYGRLARTGEPAGVGLYSRPRQLDPDPFAVDAHHLYEEAVRRLQGQAFRIRISVLGAEPLDQRTLTVITSTLDHPGSDSDRGDAARELKSLEFTQPAVEVDLPLDQAAFDRCVRNTKTIGFERWGGDPIWRRADPPPAELRLATELVDAEEALAAARLPVAVGPSLSGFPVVAPSTRPPSVQTVVVENGGILKMDDRSVHIAKSNVRNVHTGTGDIHESHHTESTVPSNPDVTALVAELTVAVTELSNSLSAEQAQQGEELTYALECETAQSQHDTNRVRGYLDQVKNWAEGIGEVATPVLHIATAIGKAISR